ncbi:MAG: polysaccharide pyruvyl transferase family protein [Acidimicrobiales bacterium]
MDAPAEPRSSWRWVRRSAPARSSRRRVVSTPPLDEIAAVVDRVAGELGATVVLASFRGARDRRCAEQLAGRLSTDVEILADDVDAHVDRVAGARLVMTSRYHPIVLAAAAGTPVWAVSGQAKVRSLVAQIDDPSVVLRSRWTDFAPGTPTPAPGSARIPPGVGAADEALRGLVARATPGRSPGTQR